MVGRVAAVLILTTAAVALTTSAAGADEGVFTTETGEPATLVGEEDAEGDNSLTAFGRTLTCPESTYTGHEVGHATGLPNGFKQATITPDYKQEACEETVGSFPATVEMNSCDYEIELGEATEGASTYALSTQISCGEEEDKIHISLWSSEAETHESEKRICTVEVGEQALEGAHATDNGDGTIGISGELTGVHVERHGLCVLDGKGTTTAEAKIHVDLDLAGEDESGAVGISLSSGDGHATETHVAETRTHLEETPGVFTTETGEPATLVGEEDAEGVNALTAFGRTLTCPESTYTGHEVGHATGLPNGFKQATITPHYKQEACEETVGSFAATVEMNSCDYEIELGEATEGTSTFALSTKVSCDKEADEIHISSWSSEAETHESEKRLCTVEVGEQALEGAHATDNGDGTIGISSKFTGVHVERHGLCLLDGKGTTTAKAEIHVDLDVAGEDESGAVGISLSSGDGHATETHVAETRTHLEETPGIFTTETGEPATLVAVESTEGADYLKMFDWELVCPGSAYTGHKINATPYEPLANGSTEITITPHFNQEACEETSNGFTATIEMNSCDFEFELGNATVNASTYTLSTAVRCEAEGDKIHIGLWDSSDQAHEEERLCTVEVGEQTLEGADATDNGDGTIGISGKLTGVHIKRQGLCELDGTGLTTTDAEFGIEVDVAGENEVGEPVGIAISQ